MKILNGVYQADQGEIRLEGKTVSTRGVLDARAQGIGMIFQEFSLISTLTVAENIFLTHEPKKKTGMIGNEKCAALVKPYFAAAVSWYENIGLGVKGGELYRMIEEIFPKEKYGWVLNPGHGIGSEEWMNSPIFKNSEFRIHSGQILQLDIIPVTKGGCCTCNIENGILIADESLRRQIADQYPKMWERIQRRKSYMREVLGICLREETLPLYETQGFLNPYLLNKGYAMVKNN